VIQSKVMIMSFIDYISHRAVIGIGPKKAITLLRKHGNIEKLLAAIKTEVAFD
jgi:5'-3' exonuclease